MRNGKWFRRTVLGAALAVAATCGAAAAQFTEKPPPDETEDEKKEPRLTLFASGMIDEEKSTRLVFFPIEMTDVKIRKLEGFLIPPTGEGETAPTVRIEAELVVENTADLPAISASIEGIGSSVSLRVRNEGGSALRGRFPGAFHRH